MTKQYLELLQDVLDNGIETENRTATKAYSVFVRTTRYDLSEGFPLLTTKKVNTKAILEELAWMLRGETNVKPLIDKDTNIWTENAFAHNQNRPGFPYPLDAGMPVAECVKRYSDAIRSDAEFAQEWGDLGPVYGKQWRDFSGIDQILALERSLRQDPNGRRHIVSAWNPAELSEMALPPCHALFQCDVKEGKLSLMLYQRSADLFLSVPFNIASYATLTHLLAHTTGYEPGEFVHTFGNLHLYSDHLDQVREQLSREPRALPQLRITRKLNSVTEFQPSDVEISGYNPHPAIKAKMSV